MSYATIVIALVLAFIAYKVLAGMVKFAVIAAIIVAAGYAYSQGMLG
ncbi:MAG: hypothetical protein WAT93_02710 [Pontixanthobacter sp.]